MQTNQPLDISMDPAEAKPRTRKTAQRKKPATKPAPQPKTEKSFFENLSDNVKSDRFRFGLGFTFTLIAVAILLLLISFMKNGALDQSLVESVPLSEIADAPEGVQNAGGAVGAVFAHMLFVDGLGVGSFVLAIYFGVLALALFGLMKIKFWSFTFKCLFTAVSVSIILGLLTYNSDSILHWGGNHGRYVNQWLLHVSDVIGAYLVTVFLIGMLVVMYFRQLHKAFTKVNTAIDRTRDILGHMPGQREVALADLPAEEEYVAEAEPQGFAEPREPQQQRDIRGFSIDEDDEPTEPAQPELQTKPFEERKPNFEQNPTPRPLEGEPVLHIDDDEDDEDIVEPRHHHREGGEPEFNIISHPGDEEEFEGVEPENDFGELTESDFEPYDIRDELSRYQFPTPELLVDLPMKESIDQAEQEENKRQIVDTLKTYNIPIARIDATIGPTVTRYEILPEEGVRIAQIKKLEDDIARSLAALGIRIIAPIPGTCNIGIEVPNRDPQTVSMRSVITSKKFRECSMALPMALGKTIKNEIFIADLAKMPHLLVAGGTGQGKSVGLNCIIASLLYKKHPGELKFVLIDPKQLEFSLYDKLENHFLAKLPDEEDAIITDPNKALATLSSICVEMDNRYTLLKKAGVRNIEEYNRKFTERRLNPEKGHKFMPYLVVIVDEFADLISTVGRDILLHISRIVAKARAAGIHMIIATQRPSTDVITGVIKSNFLGRIAFRVMQMVDSRTILDQPGANRLIGRGDMLFSHNSTMERVQCAFIDTPEVEALVEHIDNQIGYPTAYILPEPEKQGDTPAPGSIDLSRRDELFDDCARFVVNNSSASTSLLQRRFAIGYAKAGKIMDQLEAAGIVSHADGQKPRSVLVDSMQLEDLLRSLG